MEKEFESDKVNTVKSQNNIKTPAAKVDVKKRSGEQRNKQNEPAQATPIAELDSLIFGESLNKVSNSSENSNGKEFAKQKTKVFLSKQALSSNALIIGTKGTGKSDTILPALASQDMNNMQMGSTYIVSKKDIAYTLYALAKSKKRKVRILKPSANFEIANTLIGMQEYDYDKVNDLIDYKKAIKNKEIIIIDMEYIKYKQAAISATAMLLIQIQIDMQETSVTLKRPHRLYVDDCYLFLPFLDAILTAGDDYNMSCVLFAQSRAQFKAYNKDYTSLIDNNVRNTIITNGITIEDAKYFAESLGAYHTVKSLMTRSEGVAVYEILDKEYRRITGTCLLLLIKDSSRKELEASAIKHRKKLNKFAASTNKEIGIEDESGLEKLKKEKSRSTNNTLSEKLVKESEYTDDVLTDIVATVNPDELPGGEPNKMLTTNAYHNASHPIDVVVAPLVNEQTHLLDSIEKAMLIETENSEPIEVQSDDGSIDGTDFNGITDKLNQMLEDKNESTTEPELQLIDGLVDDIGLTLPSLSQDENFYGDEELSDLLGDFDDFKDYVSNDEPMDGFEFSKNYDDLAMGDDFLEFSKDDNAEAQNIAEQIEGLPIRNSNSPDDVILINARLEIEGINKRIIEVDGAKPIKIILPRPARSVNSRVKELNATYYKKMINQTQ